MRPRFLSFGLLALALAGCGAPGAFSPLGPHAAGLAALDAPWSRPVTLADMTDASDLEYDRPDGNNPFADPIDIYSESRPLEKGGPNTPVMELVARASDKPRRGFGLLQVDSDTGSFALDNKGTLAPHVRLSFTWGNNTSALVAGTSIEAMVVFVVQQKLNDKNTLDRAVGYAWSSSSLGGAVYPDLHTPALRINFNGEEIPLRVLPLETGDGLGQPCGTDAFMAMPLKTETIQDFVADFYSAYPNKYVDLDAAAPSGGSATELRRLLDLTTAPAAPTSNQDLLGIEAVGFGADVAPSACSHAVFTNLTMQRQLN